MKKLKLFLRLFRIFIASNKEIIKNTLAAMHNMERIERLSVGITNEIDQYKGIKYPVYCMMCGVVLTEIWFFSDEMEVIPVSKESVIACNKCSPNGKDCVANCEIIHKSSIVWM